MKLALTIYTPSVIDELYIALFAPSVRFEGPTVTGCREIRHPTRDLRFRIITRMEYIRDCDVYFNKHIPRSSCLGDFDVLLDECLEIAVNTRVSRARLGRGTNLQLLGNGANNFTDLVTVLEGDERGHLYRV